MPAFVGSYRIKDFYLGSVKLKELYLGSTLIWSGKLPSGKVVFESSTPGEYTVTIPKTQNFYVITVGGGSGGTFTKEKATEEEHWYKVGCSAGGSGAYLQVLMELQEGDYTVSIGEGGAHNGGFHDGSYFWSGVGGDSSLSLNGTELLKSGGGGAAYALYSSSFRGEGGAGGTNTLPSTYINIVENISGIKGQSVAQYGNATGGASVYGGHGVGGSSWSGYRSGGSDDGTPGYVKIVAA